MNATKLTAPSTPRPVETSPIAIKIAALLAECDRHGLDVRSLFRDYGDACKLERFLATAAKAKGENDFRALVVNDPKAAKRALDAERSTYVKRTMIAALDFAELVDWVRALSKSDAEDVLANVLAEPDQVRAALAPDGEVPRYVDVTSPIGVSTRPREIGGRVAANLRRLGLGEYVRDPQRSTIGPGEAEPYRYRGASFVGPTRTGQGSGITEYRNAQRFSAEAWSELRKVDSEIEIAVERGELVVTDVPIAECRQILCAQLRAERAASGY